MKKTDIDTKVQIGHQLTAGVKLLQKAVIISADGKILLLKRVPNDFNRPNKWDLPGGNSEWPEKVGEATEILKGLHKHDLSREILEETGIALADSKLPAQPIYFETIYWVEKNVYTMITGWKIQLAKVSSEVKVTLSDEHDACAWVTPAESARYDFGFAGGTSGFITKMISLARKS